MTGVFLQVRIDSSRLPGKALLPLKGKAVIDHAMASLKNINADVYALLTDRASSTELRPYAERCGFTLFIGDKFDVLKRYADAAMYYGVDTIIRATGDNPLVSSAAATAILEDHRSQKADFSCYMGLPLGTGVEIVQADSLLFAHRVAQDPYEREHVNPYLYRREEMFFIHKVSAPSRFICPQARVTLDTEDDYRYLQLLFNDLYKNAPIELDAVIPWVKRHARTAVSAIKG